MTIVHLAAPAVAIAMVAVGTGAAAQAVTGFGFALVCAPFLVLLVGPLEAVRLVIVLAFFVNGLMLVHEHRGLHLRKALGLLLPAGAVTPLAAYAVRRTEPALLSIVVGLAVLFCAALLASGRRAGRLRGRSGMFGAGVVSAAMNTASGVGGPAVAMYALNAGWPINVTRPTLQLYFLGNNLLSFISLGPVSLGPAPAVLISGALVAGYVSGIFAHRRLSEVAVIRAILTLSILGGAAAVVRGIVDL